MTKKWPDRSDFGTGEPPNFYVYPAISLRDYFATHALISFIKRTDALGGHATLAQAAYMMADAMLKERNKKESENAKSNARED